MVTNIPMKSKGNGFDIFLLPSSSDFNNGTKGNYYGIKIGPFVFLLTHSLA
jgi:hypothetical protein